MRMGHAAAGSLAGTGVTRLRRRLRGATVAFRRAAVDAAADHPRPGAELRGARAPAYGAPTYYGLQITRVVLVLLVFVIGDCRAARESRLRIGWVLASTAISGCRLLVALRAEHEALDIQAMDGAAGAEGPADAGRRTAHRGGARFSPTSWSRRATACSTACCPGSRLRQAASSCSWRLTGLPAARRSTVSRCSWRGRDQPAVHPELLAMLLVRGAEQVAEQRPACGNREPRQTGERLRRWQHDDIAGSLPAMGACVARSRQPQALQFFRGARPDDLRQRLDVLLAVLPTILLRQLLVAHGLEVLDGHYRACPRPAKQRVPEPRTRAARHAPSRRSVRDDRRHREGLGTGHGNGGARRQ